MVTANVPENVQSLSRLSPAITRDRSDGDAPHAVIHRRSGNQDMALSLLRWCGAQELADPPVHEITLTETHLVAGVRDQFGLNVGKELACAPQRRHRIPDDFAAAN